MTVDIHDREVRAGTLSIRTHRDGSICTVALAGELDLANAEEFSDELERAETGRLVRSQAMAVSRVLALTGLDESIPFLDSQATTSAPRQVAL